MQMQVKLLRVAAAHRIGDLPLLIATCLICLDPLQQAHEDEHGSPDVRIGVIGGGVRGRGCGP